MAHLIDDSMGETFEQFEQRRAGVMASRRGSWDVHFRLETVDDQAREMMRKSRAKIHKGLTTEQAEALFEDACQKVIDNRLMDVTRVELKARHRVLFMARFVNCERQ